MACGGYLFWSGNGREGHGIQRRSVPCGSTQRIRAEKRSCSSVLDLQRFPGGKRAENDTKTVQGLLRHANVSSTLGLYAQSVNSSMVEAQESMLKAILRNGSNEVD